MSTVRETVRAILNALAANLDEEEVKGAVRGWIGMKDAQEFLAANPGLRFTNEGVDPRGAGAALCATASGLDATASGGAGLAATSSAWPEDGASAEGLAAAPSGLGAAPSGLGATESGLGATASGYVGGGAALCHTPNSRGRYSLYSGIPDVDPEVTAAAETLAGLSMTSSSTD